MNSEERDEAEFEQLLWMVANDLPGAKDSMAEFLDRRAAKWKRIEDKLPGLPSPGMVLVEGPAADIPVVYVDGNTNRVISGGRVDHNRAPGELPGRHAL
jgi:hypothetical protein